MAKSFPQLGAIVPLDLGDGVVASIKLQSFPKVSGWKHRMHKLRLDDLRRLSALRKETTRELTPELWDPKTQTTELFVEMERCASDVVSECCVELSNSAGQVLTNKDEILDALQGCLDIFEMMNRILALHAPTDKGNLSSGS